MNSSEDRYENLEITVKCREDGQSWFEVIHDFITKDCQGTPYNEETGEDGDPCTCGLETMGGHEGTLDECYAWSTSLGRGIQPIDVARALIYLAETWNALDIKDDGVNKVLDWAQKEIEFEEHWNDPIEEEEEE
jgi:hypothetical protein